MSRRNLLTAVACYLAAVLLVAAFVVLRVKTGHRFAAQTAPDVLPYGRTVTPPDEHAKPFFSLHTGRTWATTDRARLSVNYRGVDSLDFRVYRVKDPVKFFRTLDNPHQVGEDEQAEVGEMTKRQPTFLEKLRQFKSLVYGAVKRYVRAQLANQSRKSFNTRFRDAEAEDDLSNRTPLSVADYARVPLLNPDQMVSSWREKLPPLEDVYDQRTISLGRREPGVYLVEAVHHDLRAFGIVVVTDLATVQKTAPDGTMYVYAVERRSGAPRAGVRVLVARGKQDAASGTTDAQGLLKLAVKQEEPPAEGGDEGEAAAGEGEAEGEAEAEEPLSDSYLVMATEGENFAISDLDSYYFGGGGEESGGGELTSYVYTDRPVYRPQQKVYFKGILRELTDAGYKLPPGGALTVAVEDPNGARIFEQDLTLNSRGTFGGELDLPEESPLGSYTISAQSEAGTATGSFNVEEYKKPEFKVRVTTPQAFVNAGERARFTVSANYFFGAPVARASVKYYVYRSRHWGWWREGEEAEDEFGADPTAEEGGAYAGYGDEMLLEGEGRLDAQGRLDVDFKVPDADPKDAWDYSYRIEAQVTDPARRTMDGSTSFTGVRSNTVAYAEPDRYVYYQGDTARIKVTANDRDGRPVQTQVRLSFFERRWEKVMKRTDYGDEYADYEVRERELHTAGVQTNQQGEAAYDYALRQNGSIRIKTTVEERGRPVVMEAGSLWVTDRAGRWADVSYGDEGSIKLVPDKKSYRPGETAVVAAFLPTDDAHLLVTTELNGVLSTRRVDVPGRAVNLELPIEARHAPNVFLNVTYVKRSELYTQELMLVVPARDKLLDLELIPNKKEYRPRETASYTVLARNGDGSPAAGAEVSLGVVDESIYQIQGETVEDIRRAFYGRRYNTVNTTFSVNYYFSGYAGTKVVQLAQHRARNQLADFKNESELVNPRVRKIFKDTAFWQPAIVTGPDGRATVKFELPDNLTTWRATARAVTADTRVGVAVSKVVERKDVIIRVAAPRFLTAGDTVTLSGIVHNYLKADKVAQVSISIEGAQLLDPPQQTVTVPAQGEHRFNWRVTAPASGELKILAKALTDAESDALETSIPVVPRGLKVTRAESAVVSDDEAETAFALNLPADADPNARTLRVEVAPSVAGALFGALDYLTTFPYGCTEQTMSSFLPNVIVAQALRHVETSSVRDEGGLERKVKKGLRRLYGLQHDDGGWGWWKDDQTDPWMTAYVVHGLAEAREAGYEVDGERLEKGRERLRALLAAGGEVAGVFGEDARAFMAYAHRQSGASDARFAADLFGQRARLGAYGQALLALTLQANGDAARAKVVAAELERSAKAGPAEAYWDSRGASGVEATALAVKALARLAPQSPVLPKAARWLVKSRRFGHHWLSTRETAFAIYGLIDYVGASRELNPDYALEVYVNGEQVFARQVTGADAASAQVFNVQRRGGEVAASNSVRVVKRGPGALYLSATLTHHTNEEQVAAQSAPALKLSREYLRLRVVEKSDGVLGWQTEPLSGEVRSGDILVSRLKLEGAGARYLMVEDPLPAGCEPVEEVSGINFNYTESGWSDWYSAREFRDNRVVLFLDHFDGSAQFQYAMRVQVPGRFRAAPARAELMYQPDVRANAATGALTILDSNR